MSTKKQSRISKFFSDFKAFISKGNILDMAVGVVIGGAFGKIVTSLVNDIIMPLITLIVGGKSVDDWKYVITPASEDAAESAVYYGHFLQSIIDFIIIAFFIFLALRIIMNFKAKLKKREEGQVVLDKKERKQLSRNLKKEGYSRDQIDEEIAKKEQQLTLEAERQAELEKATHQTPETTEDILKDIRELLKTTNQSNQ